MALKKEVSVSSPATGSYSLNINIHYANEASHVPGRVLPEERDNLRRVKKREVRMIRPANVIIIMAERT